MNLEMLQLIRVQIEGDMLGDQQKQNSKQHNNPYPKQLKTK